MKPPVNYDHMVKTLFKQDTEEMMYIHCAFGVVGEAIELAQATSKENIKEELGDYFFYFTKLCHLERVSYEGFLVKSAGIYDTTLLFESNEIMDLIKKSFIYGGELHRGALYTRMHQSAHIFHFYLQQYNFTLEEITEANIEKLSKRYYQKVFSTEQALERADKSGDDGATGIDVAA